MWNFPSLAPVATLAAALALGAGAARADDAAAPPPAAPPPAAKPKTDPNFGVATQLPFAETSAVLGKVEADLTGVWLLVAYAQVAPEKFKTFPQLLKIESSGQGPEFHLLDVRLPKEAEQEVEQASMRTLTRWVPSAQLRASLGATWSQLAPAAEKTLNEYLFAKIEYTLSAPEQYAQAFPQRDEPLQKVLDGSPWTLKVAETYRPRDLPADARIAQLIERTTIYGAKKVGADQISGALVLGFVAAGAGTPLPFNFPGDFVLYRLASP